MKTTNLLFLIIVTIFISCKTTENIEEPFLYEETLFADEIATDSVYVYYPNYEPVDNYVHYKGSIIEISENTYIIHFPYRVIKNDEVRNVIGLETVVFRNYQLICYVGLCFEPIEICKNIIDIEDYLIESPNENNEIKN